MSRVESGILISKRDKDGFVIPAPRAPKRLKYAKVTPKEEAEQLAQRCGNCDQLFDKESIFICSSPDCNTLIECDCFESCASKNCDAIWCRDHAPRCSKICRVDKCHKFLCLKHAWHCTGCGIDACDKHTGEWNLCDSCCNVRCDVCLMNCDNVDCNNLFCKTCCVDGAVCAECND